MKALLIFVPLLGIFSCASNRLESAQEPVVRTLPSPAIEEPAAVSEPEEEAEVVFDPMSITLEEKETTMDEMRILIAEINHVIRAKDYDGWFSYLADDFVAIINSPSYLIQLSESSRQLKSQNIVLKTPRDYFTHVVVASRENIRVDASLDDIEFLSHNRVKAYTVNTRSRQRLRLFEFVKAGGAWKIAFSS
ncbi:MAG: hypothetical protein LBK63_04705 [Treponema sp.]|jgi:hypothetical protein|nr:hypothetical protein [Treponema sp.]